MKRRDLLRTSAAMTLAPLWMRSFENTNVKAEEHANDEPNIRLKLGLNAFTFNTALIDGEMTRNDVIDFCRDHQIDGVDMTGYYFQQYPEVPDDRLLFEFKRYAFENGVTVSGTGVKNNFSVADAEQFQHEIQLVKNWIPVTAKLGGDVLRIFSGRRLAKSQDRRAIFDRMVTTLQDCAKMAADHGVILGLQPHHDFLKTAEQTIELLDAVDDPWLKVVLDTGSLRDEPVYDEIEKLLPHSVTWQLKKDTWIDGNLVPVDLPRIKAIINKVGYSGFLPLELTGSFDDLRQRRRQAADFATSIRDEVIG
ncbi:sugar phosphate isomerase/epimerase [Rhodopirellula sp. JC740]|uniref:Sugar phosphate isomerase/epimerase n=1 Tax=Rhodopirellula halodulae TaxID=2894198 RepID=A0ABS8NMK0_9BACT|nr:sugar phosphate isomerase/epimerase family protein [Rhodopirellula sp. JC740]MCC9644730.1 sugar phosphate isomerase/epimerase [Rhodopirellula sp. JC740]